MPTINTDFYPATRGQDLGRPGQEWDINAFNITIAPGGSLNGANFLTGNGNAIALQGRPLADTAPTSNQVIVWDGTTWLPGSGDADALQGNPVSSALPVANQALIWDGAQWAPANQSGTGTGGASLGYVVTGYSATPTFTPSPQGACTFKITLTGDVDSSTLDTTGVTAGALFTFIIVQDGTGGRWFTWPTNFLGALTNIGSNANQNTVQEFVFDGTSLYAKTLGVIYP